MKFKLFQCNTDKIRRNQALCRGVLVPHILESLGYSSALSPKSDVPFPVVQHEDEWPSKTASSEQNQIADTFNNSIAEGVVKRYNLFNLSLVGGQDQTKGFQYYGESKNPVEEGPDTQDGCPNMKNQGNVDKQGTTGQRSWVDMVQGEVWYQLNDSDQKDTIEIEILLYNWCWNNGNLRVKVNV